MRSKLLLSFLLVLICIAPIVSAFEFDNVKEYDSATKTVRIRNAFGLGKLLYEAQLKTKLVEKVPRGYQKVAEIEMRAYEARQAAIGTFEFLDRNNNDTVITRNVDLKYKSFENVDVDVYETRCTERFIAENKTTTQDCRRVLTGTRTERRLVWNDLTDSNFNKDDILTIGLFTEVQKGDRIEWIPTLWGFRVPEWAEWTEDLNVGLQAWWSFDTDASTTAVDDFAGLSNGTYNLDAETVEHAKLGNATYFKNGNGRILWDQLTTVPSTMAMSSTFSISYWMSSNASSGAMFSGTLAACGADMYNYWAGGKIRMAFQNDYDYTTFVPNSNQWYHVIVVANGGTNKTIYIDGVNNGTIFNSGDFDLECYMEDTGGGNSFAMGAEEGGGNKWHGYLDEFGVWNRTLTQSEIADLYNGGTGISYTQFGSGSEPTITLNNPANSYKSSNASVTFNCSAHGEFGATNATLIIDGTHNYTITNTTANQNLSLEVTRSLSQGSHTWKCVGSNAFGQGTSGTRSLTIDYTNPNVSVLSPPNSTSYFALVNPYTVAINVSYADNVALDSCWYFNGTDNNTITCGNNISTGFNPGWNHIYFYGNDTIGNENSDSVSFFINFVNYSVDYLSSMLESTSHVIYINISASNLTGLSGNITYNHTVYALNESFNNGTYAVLQRNFSAPYVSNDTVLQFEINFSVDTAELNTSIYNQTIYNVQPLTVQAAPCTPAAYNFTLYNELNLSTIGNGVFNYNFKYGTEDNSTLSEDFGQISSTEDFYVCFNDTISNNWTLGQGSVFYTASGYAERRYYLFDGSTFSNETQVIKLYDIETSAQTSFRLEVEDTSLTPYVDKFTSLLRWYPNLNEYKIVDMGETDDNGETVIHVAVEDIDYRVGVYERNGSLIKLADPTRFTCLINPCTYTLKVSPGDKDYTSIYDVDYTFSYNKTTGVWSFVYSDSSQKTSSVNLSVQKITGTSTYTVCSATTTGHVGAVTCNTSAYSGTLKGLVHRAASPEVPLAEKIISTATTAFRSAYGLWLSLLIALPIVFIFAAVSPIAAIIGGVVSLIPALYFGAITWTIVGGIAVLAGIVFHFLKRIG